MELFICTKADKIDPEFKIVNIEQTFTLSIEKFYTTHQDGKISVSINRQPFVESLTEGTYYYGDVDQDNKITKIQPLPGQLNLNTLFIYVQIKDNRNFGLAWDKFPVATKDGFKILDAARKNLVHGKLDIDYKEQQIEFLNAMQLMHCRRINQLSLNNNCKQMNIQTKWRMVVGMGEANVYENDMTLHQPFGFPYIPGSALKGRIRSATIKVYFGGDEDMAKKQKWFTDIFGSEKDDDGNKGEVRFLDTFPLNIPTIEADVIENENSEYYKSGGVTPPSGWDKPNPVFFITVSKTTYRMVFMVSKKNDKKIYKIENKEFNLTAITEHLVQLTIDEFAFGAKALKGYGRFKSTPIN